jgi:hypothetical protein
MSRVGTQGRSMLLHDSGGRPGWGVGVGLAVEVNSTGLTQNSHVDPAV